MLLTYRFKLKPTKAQYAELDRLCDEQRQLYNAALQERIEAWRKTKTSVTKLDQFKSLTEIRSFDPTYQDVAVAMSRWSIAKVDDAFKGFFNRIKRGDKAGFPRFRSKGRWRSFGFAQWNGIRLKGGILLFAPFSSGVKVNLHRPIPDGSSLKSCTFTRIDRHWFVCIALDAPIAQESHHQNTSIGLDWGVEHLLTTSDGLHIENIKPRGRKAKEIRKAQRALSRCRKSSRRRVKVRAKLARLQRSVRNARDAYLHQVSAQIAVTYSFIGLERLKVRNMTASAKGTVNEPGANVRHKAGLNRETLDTAPATLIRYICYKAERAGGIVVMVDPRNTSQICSSCGGIVRKKLSERVHSCSCGTELQRDHNAALNILSRAEEAHRRARPPEDVNVGHRPERGLEIASVRAA